jgi:thiol-disulfide isomerase/thioredoxin
MTHDSQPTAQPNVKLRMAAMVATVLALLAISMPFVWQHNVEAEPMASAAPNPLASVDAVPVSAEQEDGAACMANAKPANLNFTLKDIDGKDVTLSQFKGKVIVLNLWATWCGPCKAEIPGFVELQAKYRNDVVIIGYSTDDPADKAKAFATEYKINYPVVLGEGKEDLQEAYGPIWGIPSTFIISREGKVCKKHIGIAPKAVFEKEIKALL